jgi:predicted ArsR family transcriptional regulator
MKTTRQRLLETLETRQIASAADLARALSLSAANLRRCLAALAAEGLVEVIDQRQPAGRGRPAQRYRLTRQTHQHNLAGLAGALLDHWLAACPPEDRPACWRQLAAQLAGAGAGGGPLPANFTQRLYQGIRRLNDLAYQARWEAHAQAPRLILEHCPYAALLPAHPELCQLDVYLLEALFAVPARQLEKLAPNSQGLPRCIFLLQT